MVASMVGFADSLAYTPRAGSYSVMVLPSYHRRLPPASQRRIAPLPLLVEVRMAPLPHKYRRGVIDGYAIIYDPGTRMIMDVAVVFGSH